jgi:prepilin-type N-terminal cleavage/methylation domain-containing protein
MSYLKGFSLIEVVIAISVIGLLGLILTTIMSRSFKAGDKTKLLSQVKQNGQLALNVMDEAIKSSEAVVCVGKTFAGNPNNDVITLQKKDGSLVRFRFVQKTQSLNSGIKQDFPTLSQLSPPALTQPVNTNDFCDPARISPLQDSYLTNASQTLGVSVDDLNFTLNNNVGSKSSVTLSFDLKTATRAPADFANQLGLGRESFQTTVQLR